MELKGIKRAAKNSRYVVALLLILGLVIGCGATAPATTDTTETAQIVSGPAASAGLTIVWSKADSEPTDAIGKWQPIVDYLAANLHDAGIQRGEVKIAPDTATISRWIASGEVDLVIDSFYPAMIVANYSGAMPLAIRYKGKPERHAVFFTLADSGVTSIDQLQGETIAFAERDSTSGFMLPMAYLKADGRHATEVPTASSVVPADTIGYVFAGDDDVAVQWVLTGTVVAGAVDNETFAEFAKSNPGALTVLAETDSMLRDTMLLVRKDLDPTLKDAIKAALLRMHETPEGRVILEENKAVSFVAIQGRTEVAWKRTEEIFHLIND